MTDTEHEATSVDETRDEHGRPFRRRAADRSITSTPGVFHQFLNNGPSIGWIKDREGRYVYVNQPFMRLIDVRCDSLITKTDKDWLPEHLALEARKNDEQVFERGETMEFVEKFPSKEDGVLKEWLVFKFLLQDTHGTNLLGAVGADIHERRQVEKHLAAQYLVSRCIAEASSLREATPKLLNSLGNSFDWDAIAIWILDREQDLCRCLDVWAGEETHADELRSEAMSVLHDSDFAMKAVLKQSPVWLKDVHQDEGPRSKAAARAGLMSAFAYPIWHEKEIAGVLEFYAASRREIDPDMMKMLDSLSSQLSQFMRRKSAEEAVTLSNRLLEAVTKAQSNFIADMTPFKVFQTLLGDILALTQSPAGFLAAIDPPFASLRILAETESPPKPGDLLNTFKRELSGEHILAQLRQKKPVVFSRTQMPVAIESDSSARGEAIVLPLHKGNEFVGVMALAARPGGYSLPTHRFLEPCLATCGLLIEAYHNQAERLHVEAALRESETRMRTIVEAAADAIIAVGEDGIIESVNPAAQQIFGYQQAELVGANLEKLLPNFKSQSSRSPVYESVGKRKDDTSIPVELAVSSAEISDQRVNTVIVRDISERKEAERRVTEFYSMISHELRTPLTSIRGSLGLILGGVVGEVTEDIREFLQIAHSNCDRLLTLINDILDIRKLEAEKFELHLQKVKPAQLVNQTIFSLKTTADQANVDVESRIQTDRFVLADPDRVIQVLTNLISNAVKFSDPGTQVLVLVSDGTPGNVRFSISDCGPGIPGDQMSKLFNKFQQLDSSDSRKKGGTGLGLAISKGLVELHSGTIGVDSTHGEGSTFWFEIPESD